MRILNISNIIDEAITSATWDDIVITETGHVLADYVSVLPQERYNEQRI